MSKSNLILEIARLSSTIDLEITRLASAIEKLNEIELLKIEIQLIGGPSDYFIEKWKELQ